MLNCSVGVDHQENRSRLNKRFHTAKTQIGRSLEALLKTLTIADPRGQRLAVTHVAALRTVLENDIKGHGGAAGAALLARLQDLTRKAG